MDIVVRFFVLVIGLILIGLILSIFLKLAAVIVLVLVIGALAIWIMEKLKA
ncbi:MAG: hypothetical protein V3U16_01300 [Candidatus Neomarinimicrobiota bacterium]